MPTVLWTDKLHSSLLSNLIRAISSIFIYWITKRGERLKCVPFLMVYAIDTQT